MRDWEPIGAGGESGMTAGDPLHPGIIFGGAGTRFDLELTSGDMLGGAKLMHAKPVPQPFSVPRTEAEALNEGAAEVLTTAPQDPAAN